MRNEHVNAILSALLARACEIRDESERLAREISEATEAGYRHLGAEQSMDAQAEAWDDLCDAREAVLALPHEATDRDVFGWSVDPCDDAWERVARSVRWNQSSANYLPANHASEAT